MVSRRIKYFNLEKIMKSGQIFRMYEPEDDRFIVYSREKRLEMVQKNDRVDFMCTSEEFEEYWENYFDLKRDYAAIVEKAIEYNRKVNTPGTAFLRRACEYGADIRVLKQDIWEMMISFIISQQKQITSIRKCIEALCERFGEKKEDDIDGSVWYTFPSAESIVSGGPDGLKGLSLGYRERYIYGTAEKYIRDGIPDEILRNMPAEEVKKYLCSFSGIGNKVADCICLFGAGFTDAFPIDVHIKEILYREFFQEDKKKQIEGILLERTGSGISKKKILDSLSYSEYEVLIEENFSVFKGVKGILQQWIFAYEIS